MSRHPRPTQVRSSIRLRILIPVKRLTTPPWGGGEKQRILLFSLEQSPTPCIHPHLPRLAIWSVKVVLLVLLMLGTDRAAKRTVTAADLRVSSLQKSASAAARESERTSRDGCTRGDTRPDR